MDSSNTLPDSVPPGNDLVRKSQRATVALSGAVLLLSTAAGGATGLAIGTSLHHSTANAAASSPAPLSGGYGDLQVNPGRWAPGPRTQQSAAQESTSSATTPQLVGLVRIQSTLGYESGASVGTGMILSSAGEVATNHHVIAGATKIVVTVMSTGQQYNATLVGSDTTDDIAVLQLDGASGLSTAPTSTTAAAVGDSVTAVGDAEGATAFTASPGKVTAVNQTISPSDGGATETLSGIIQYAADVMSGDSGGATYNSSGAVVGMTTAASSGGAQTNGYAIPIAKVLSVAADLENHVANTNYSYGLPAFLGVGVNANAVVQEVYSGTGAAAGGLQPGDQIVAINGTAVSSASGLQAATRKYNAGQTVSITWITASGQRQTARVRLMTGPAA